MPFKSLYIASEGHSHEVTSVRDDLRAVIVCQKLSAECVLFVLFLHKQEKYMSKLFILIKILLMYFNQLYRLLNSDLFTRACG